MSLDGALQTFYAECEEMLAEAERLLIQLEQHEGDDELLNALFRCVHTVKGSAGLFGLDAIVEFTHVVESVLGDLRDGRIGLDEQLVPLLLQCRDHIENLVELGEQPPDASMAEGGDELHASLSKYLESGSVDKSLEAAGDENTHREAGVVDSGAWHISIRFHPDVLRHGMDPAGFIRYLRTLGELQHVITITDWLPRADNFDPESCYLGFEICLLTDVDRATIEDVFEFVREDSELRLIAPHSEVGDYIELIKSLPEDDQRLGDILVAFGALTESELAEGLRSQSDGEANHASAGLPAEEGAAGPAQRKQNRANHQFVRVRADKLDELINLVGELVIAGAAAGLSARENGDTATQEAVNTVSSLVEEVRDSSLQLRMVPIGEVFQRFHRVVRDVSQELDKNIILEISGGETELDKTMVERITDPLTHLVRNAIDHGIENAERRAAAGKSKQGRLRLNAFHDTGDIVIEVSDDGGGLDRDRILEKARARNLVGEDQELPDTDIDQLIFEPGFSTADAVTNLSGRGVGMDVVRRNIEGLRGSIEVQSQPGAGSLFRIRLPLTLAIIDGFLTEAGQLSYVLPLESVVECVELTDAQRQETRERSIINLRGDVLPFIRLRDYFDLGGEAGQRENILVVRHGTAKAGLIVDRLFGECQTVIKPLGKLFANLNGISGSTILGSGEVALILDVPSLVQRAIEQEAQSVRARNEQQGQFLSNKRKRKLHS